MSLAEYLSRVLSEIEELCGWSHDQRDAVHLVEERLDVFDAHLRRLAQMVTRLSQQSRQQNAA